MPVCVDLTVDRVEAGWAVVEWCGARVSEIPLDVFPVPIAEGDRVRFVVRGGRPPAGPVRTAVLLLPRTPLIPKESTHVGSPSHP